MSSLNLTIADLPRFLEAKARTVETLTFERPLKVIAVAMQAEIKGNFYGSHDPDGNPWAPLKRERRSPKGSQRHKRAKARGGTPKPLLDTGILAASWTVQGAPGNVFDVSGFSLLMGTNLVSEGGFPYPAAHQFGTRHMPARRMAAWNERMIAFADARLADHAAAALTP